MCYSFVDAWPTTSNLINNCTFENTFGGNRLSVGDVQHVSESPGTLTTSAIMEENAKEMVGRSIGGVETTMTATDSLGVFLLDSHSLLQTEQVDQGTPKVDQSTQRYTKIHKGIPRYTSAQCDILSQNFQHMIPKYYDF